MGAAQELQQNVCQKYGWSIDFSSGEDGCWCVEVIVGIGDKRRFVAPTKQEKKEAPTKQEKKEGKEAVSALALEGLAKEIEREESKPTKTLAEIFSHKKITIYDSSNPATWDFFWKKPPKVVGIDTEGNQVSPPVLVQISTEDYTILEVPTKKNISTNLQRLLDDSRITKVFCDNFSHRDKKCLGLTVSENNDYNFAKPPIVDLEFAILELMGKVNVPRGLSKIVTLCMPELNVRIEKPKTQKGRYKNIGPFALIEQGKAEPLRGLFDLQEKDQQYAALDSWCTLKAYQELLQLIEQK